MKNITRLSALLALCLWVAGCSTMHTSAPPPSAPADPLDAAVSGFLEHASHKATFEITDVTDPEHPQLVYHQEGNLLGQCGVRNILALALGASSMGSYGGAGTLGTFCMGTNQASEQKVPIGLITNGNLVIGRANPGECSASANPWPCCLGSGSGCNIVNGRDLVTWTEGQALGSNTNTAANWLTFLNAGAPNFSTLIYDASPALYYDDATLMGIRVSATAGGSAANFPWCEYAIRTYGGASGAGPFSVTYNSATTRPGWQIAHGQINPCQSKGSGQVWIATWTLTIA